MGDFAIVGEGVTDQIVLRNVLLGYYRDRNPEPLIVFEQPPLDATGTAGSPYAHGGWTLVVRYLSQGSYRQALQFNRYVVIQIDTDIASDLGVVRTDDISDDFIELIIGKLGSYIAEEDRAVVRDRVPFAIFDEIERWLLPLVFDRSERTSLPRRRVSGSDQPQVAQIERDPCPHKEVARIPGATNGSPRRFVAGSTSRRLRSTGFARFHERSKGVLWMRLPRGVA
jgi:hypothetical protein